MKLAILADYQHVAPRTAAQFIRGCSDFNTRLADVPFVAGDRFSAADITALATVDFATRALNTPIPAECTAFKGWYDTVAARESMTA